MEWLKYTALVIAGCLVVFGLVTLAMAWLAPRALDTRFMTGMLTGARLEPTRRNRTLSSAGGVIGGTYIWLAIGGLVVPALVTLVAWLAVILLLRRARTPAGPAPA